MRPPETYSDEVRDSFEYCGDCESLVVSADRHECPKENAGYRKASERAKLADADDRPAGEEVLFSMGRSQTKSWAYHELDENGDPLHEVTYQSGSDTGPRSEAINNGCYPCARCRLIQERGQADE